MLHRLYGISLLQSYLYFFDRKRDPTWLQCAVLVIVTLETIHSAMIMHATYHYSIYGACDPSEALEIVWYILNSIFLRIDWEVIDHRSGGVSQFQLSPIIDNWFLWSRHIFFWLYDHFHLTGGRILTGSLGIHQHNRANVSFHSCVPFTNVSLYL